MRAPREAVTDLTASFEAEAAKFEAAVPLLEARRENALLVSQRVIDKTEADVRGSDAEREAFIRRVLSPAALDALGADLGPLLANLRARELALVELVSDRVLDFAEEAKSTSVAAKARAAAFRETVRALRAVEAAPENSGRVDAATLAPELADAPPAPADGDGARLA